MSFGLGFGGHLTFLTGAWMSLEVLGAWSLLLNHPCKNLYARFFHVVEGVSSYDVIYHIMVDLKMVNVLATMMYIIGFKPIYTSLIQINQISFTT